LKNSRKMTTNMPNRIQGTIIGRKIHEKKFFFTKIYEIRKKIDQKLIWGYILECKINEYDMLIHIRHKYGQYIAKLKIWVEFLVSKIEKKCDFHAISLSVMHYMLIWGHNGRL